MKVLAKEKSRLLAESRGWSLRFAEGFLEGDLHRRRSQTAAVSMLVGRDEFALGFRAGYFDRSPLAVNGAENMETTKPLETPGKLARQNQLSRPV